MDHAEDQNDFAFALCPDGIGYDIGQSGNRLFISPGYATRPACREITKTRASRPDGRTKARAGVNTVSGDKSHLLAKIAQRSARP